MEKPDWRGAEQRTQTICLLILSGVAIGVSLLYLRQVLVPFVLAVFLTMVVTPVMDLLMARFRFPRGLAILSTLALAFLVLGALGGLVSRALAEVLDKKQTYVAQVDGLLTGVEERFDGLLESLEGLVPGDEEPAEAADDPAVVTEVEDDDVAESDAAPRASLADLREKVGGMALGAIGWVTSNTLALLSNGLLVMVFMMFLITGHRRPESRDPDSLGAQLRRRIKEYLRVKISVSALTGTATFLILDLLGVDLALVFGLAAFFLNFIPNVGSAVAILLPLPVILLAPAEDVPVMAKVLAVALPATVQFLVGNVLEPRWMGRSLDLNPIVILLSLIFWGVLWGPVGMLLSVPITAVLKMLFERSELTRPVAVLFSEGE